MSRYNPDGTLAWAKRAGGTGGDYGNGIASLADGSSLVTGSFQGAAVFGPGEANETTLTGGTMFIAYYNADGTLAWAKRAGGSNAYGRSIASVDGAVLVTGTFRGAAVFGPGEVNETTLTAAGSEDIFIAKYNQPIVPATPTPIPTNTPAPPTATPTSTPTETPVPPTATPTITPTPIPTSMPTATPVAPTETPTRTPTSVPTSVTTRTPVPPTATPTPAATKIPTATPVPVLNLVPNKTVVGTGDLLLMGLAVSERISGMGELAAYVVVRTPDGEWYSFVPNRGCGFDIKSGITPAAVGEAIPAFGMPILNHEIADSLARGDYWFAAAVFRAGDPVTLEDWRSMAICSAESTVTVRQRAR